MITDAQGIPLAALVTGANAHDVTQAWALVEAIPSVKGKPGRPRRRPLQVYGDRGYDSGEFRDQLRSKHILPVVAKRGRYSQIWCMSKG